MDLSTAAQAMSRKAVKTRTRRRNLKCKLCGKSFTARSAKARYCSRTCLTKVWYLRKKEGLFPHLDRIHHLVENLLGRNPRLDPTLKRISELLVHAKSVPS